MSFQHIEDAAIAACIEVGVDYRAVPHDGRFYVADISNDPRGKNDGRIQITPDGQRVQVFNYKSGKRAQLFLNSDKARTMSQAERQHIERERRKREAKQPRREIKSKYELQDFLLTLNKAPQDQPTLIAKQIQAHGMRVGTWTRKFRDADGNYQEISIENSLIVPMYNDKLELASVQAIFPHVVPELGRNKDFWPGLPIAGLFWWIGGKSDPTAILEGVATAASFYEDTGLTSFISFSASNMPAVAKIVVSA